MVKSVKILLMQELSDDYYSQKLIRDSITDWEEISEEDLRFLRNNLHRIYPPHGEFVPCIITKDDEPILERISQLRAAIEKEKRQQEEREAKKKQAKEAKERERLLKKLGSEKTLYEELKKRFEV